MLRRISRRAYWRMTTCIRDGNTLMQELVHSNAFHRLIRALMFNRVDTKVRLEDGFLDFTVSPPSN